MKAQRQYDKKGPRGKGGRGAPGFYTDPRRRSAKKLQGTPNWEQVTKKAKQAEERAKEQAARAFKYKGKGKGKGKPWGPNAAGKGKGKKGPPIKQKKDL